MSRQTSRSVSAFVHMLKNCMLPSPLKCLYNGSIWLLGYLTSCQLIYTESLFHPEITHNLYN